MILTRDSLKVHGKTIKSLLLVCCGSVLFLTLKLIVVKVLVEYLEFAAWFSYFGASVLISLLGWVYHSKVSFSQALQLDSLRRYVEQAIGLKISENLLFNLLVYFLGFGPLPSVIFVSILVFGFRLWLYFTYVFKTDNSNLQSQPLDNE